MLSFLKEGSNTDLPDKNVNSKPRPDDSTSGPDINGDGDGGRQQDYLTVACRDNKIKRGTIVLICLFAAGLLCLLFMIKKTAPSAAVAGMTGEDAQIEAAITQLTGVKMTFSSRIDQIVKKFNQFSDVKKLQVKQLQKNPFVHEKDFGLLALQPQGEPDDAQGGVTAEAMKSELVRQVESMQLLSIMQTEHGSCCMIDEKVLYEGDSLRGLTVCKITEHAVELCAEGMKFVLRISPEF